MKNSTNAETENPFTMRGLIIAIIQDLNDIRQKIELLEKYLVSENDYNFIVKVNERKKPEND